MDAKVKSNIKGSDTKVSLVALVISFVLAVLLFVEIELVSRRSEVIEAKLENRIQRIEEELQIKTHKMFQQIYQPNEIPAKITKSKERDPTIWDFAYASSAKGLDYNYRQRRNAASTPSSLSLQQIRQEIGKKLAQVCSTADKLCQTGPQGPPGDPGALGYPGYKGEKGATGKTGPRGPLGVTGAQGERGKQGPIGPQGSKGEKGETGFIGSPGRKGDVGPMGQPGHKGSIGWKGNKGSKGSAGIHGPKGECVIFPKIVVFPESLDVFLNKPAKLYCWVQGVTSVRLIWSKAGGKSLSDTVTQVGELHISKVTRSHVGTFICTAYTSNGILRAVSSLHLKEPPKFTLKPRFLVVSIRGSVVNLCCQAAGSPSPKVEWTRAQSSHNSGLLSQENGCVRISAVNGYRSYTCRATNKYGVTETTTVVDSGLGHSAILQNNGNYLRNLSNWLKPVVQGQSSYWMHCWRASVDGWAAATFHKLCDNKGPTVTIIKAGRYIFGGYTSTSWVSSCSYYYDSKPFLFSLVNKPGWAPVKLSLPGQIRGSSSYSDAIYGCSSNGPAFGAGSDMCISDYASSNTYSYTNLGYSYSAPSGYSYRSTFTRTFLAGAYYFQPDEVETFYETT